MKLIYLTMGNIRLEIKKLIEKNMKKSILVVVLLIFSNTFVSIAQISPNPLIGTWEIVKRDYVYQKNNLAYTFNKDETLAYSGQKIVFCKDSLLAYTTFFSEVLTTPIKYSRRKRYVKDLDVEGNLKGLLSKKGASFDEFTITENLKATSSKHLDYYTIYYFLDGTIGIFSDFSLFYLKKISRSNLGFWKRNVFGEAVINGNYSESLSIPVDNSMKYFLISYLPNKKGENYLHIESDAGTLANSWATLYKIKDEINHGYYSNIFEVDKSWKKIKIFIGGSPLPLVDGWEIRYKFIKEVAKIKNVKSVIYKVPNSHTKMYLLKDDNVEILEIKDDWLKVRYYGKKTIEGWIKKSDIE